MNIALIFAGGTGQRMNSKGKPKQFLKLHGKPIIMHTIEKFQNCRDIDRIVVVCLEPWVDCLKEEIRLQGVNKVSTIVQGGRSGQESIYMGLCAIKEMKDINHETIVVIHDGFRPLITERLISENVARVKEKGNAVTVVKATETITEINKEGIITAIADRNAIRIAKAPQSFYLADILESHEKARAEGLIKFVDSASLMSHYGHSLYTVIGSTENIKITTASDFYTFRALYEAQENSQILGI